MARILGATSTIFLSLLIGAVALAFTAVQFPGFFDSLLDGGSWLENQIGSTPLEAKYNVWVKFLISQDQIVFMGFVIVSRIVLSILGALLGGAFGGRRY